MPEKPVAKLALDTRAHGPYFCKGCDEENEDALLMSDGTVVCPECEEPMPEFQPFTDVIISASPISKSGKDSGKRDDKWVIEWTNIDSSRDATVAYDNREEALAAGAEWAKDQAESEFDQFSFDEGDEMSEMLNDVLAAAKRKDDLATVKAWLDYQNEADPNEKMSIGPSGITTDRSHELS